MAVSRAVVDASILAGSLIGEPGKEAWQAALQRTEILAPTLVRFEVSNAVKFAPRLSTAERVRLLTLVRNMPLHHPDPVDWWDEAIGISLSTPLTFYDATYLAIAKRTGTELWTHDREMQKVAERYRLEVRSRPPFLPR